MRALDLIGQTFGRLTVVSRAGTVDGKASWNVRCECGTEKSVAGDSLRQGKTVSCGCRRSEALDAGRAELHRRSRKHGKSKTDLYEIWRGILKRCTNEEHPAFPDYGGRGIRIHEKWLENFESFEADIIALIGPRPSKGHSIDRFPNNDGNYEPGNIRWATAREQVHNSRSFKNGLTHRTKAELIAEIERMRPTFEAACEYRLKADEMRAAPVNTGEVFDLGPLYEARSALFAAVDASRAKESK